MYVYILVDKFSVMIRINVSFLIQLVKKLYFKMWHEIWKVTKYICVTMYIVLFTCLLSCVEDLRPLAKQI